MGVASSARKAPTFLGTQQREGCRHNVLSKLGVLQHGSLSSSGCLQEGHYPELSFLGTLGSVRYYSNKQREKSKSSQSLGGQTASKENAHAASFQVIMRGSIIISKRSPLGSRAQQNKSNRRQPGRTSHVQQTTTTVPEQHSLLQCILQVRRKAGWVGRPSEKQRRAWDDGRSVSYRAIGAHVGRHAGHAHIGVHASP